MIICIVENCNEWDDYGIPYFIQTQYIKNKAFRFLLEYEIEELWLYLQNNPFTSLDELGWSTLIQEELNNAFVEIKNINHVDKVLKINFHTVYDAELEKKLNDILVKIREELEK